MPRPELHKRTWLNPPNRSADSYVIVHASPGEAEFILADCSRSISIHTYGEGDRGKCRFIKKLVKIRSHIDMLIEHVESKLD